jgi:hypothetical protein
MSLKAFHLVFILASIALSTLVGFWGLLRSNEGVSLLLGVIGVLSAAGLTVYLGWFVKKLRNLSYLGLSLALLMVSQPVWACAVCFGDPNSPMVKSANTAILFLLAVIGSLLGGFAGLFLYWGKRARRQAPTSAPFSALT